MRMRRIITVPRVLLDRGRSSGGSRHPWGGLGSGFFYRGLPTTFVLVIPYFIEFLRFELWTSSARVHPKTSLIPG